MFKSRLYDLFLLNYANELLGSYATWIFTMYNYMSLCNIPLLTSLLVLMISLVAAGGVVVLILFVSITVCMYRRKFKIHYQRHWDIQDSAWQLQALPLMEDDTASDLDTWHNIAAASDLDTWHNTASDLEM